MAADKGRISLIGPATKAMALVKDGSDISPGPIRMVTIGVAGVLVFRDIYGEINTTGTLPVGNYPVAAVAIMPATTADQLTGWY